MTERRRSFITGRVQTSQKQSKTRSRFQASRIEMPLGGTGSSLIRTIPFFEDIVNRTVRKWKNTPQLQAQRRQVPKGKLQDVSGTIIVSRREKVNPEFPQVGLWWKSACRRAETITRENTGEVGIYYINKEAANLPRAGVQFPTLVQNAASNGIIHCFGEKNNRNILNQT